MFCCNQWQNTICVSPSIRYAAHPVYAKPCVLGGRQYRLAFQLKIKAGTYRMFPSTLREVSADQNQDFDQFVPNSEMEWHTRRHGTLMLYGIVVIDEPVPP